MRMRWISVAIVLAACGTDEPSGPPPLNEIQGTIKKIAVNDTSIFVIDANSVVIEIGLDGKYIGQLKTSKTVASELVAFRDWVAWLDVEGTGMALRRRRIDLVTGMEKYESMHLQMPHLAGSVEGVFYSEMGAPWLFASWPDDGSPQRIASPGSGATILSVDASFSYSREVNTAIVKYSRQDDTMEMVLDQSMGATIKDGQLAHRTADGIRERDLFTSFDRLVGSPPPAYTCDLLIAGRAVMCGKYRAMDGLLDELLEDPVLTYASAGKDLYWVKPQGGDKPTSAIFKVDAEAPLEK